MTALGRILARYITCNTQNCRMVIENFMFTGRHCGECTSYWGKVMRCLGPADAIYFREEAEFYIYIGGLTELRIVSRNKTFLGENSF